MERLPKELINTYITNKFSLFQLMLTSKHMYYLILKEMNIYELEIYRILYCISLHNYTNEEIKKIVYKFVFDLTREEINKWADELNWSVDFLVSFDNNGYFTDNLKLKNYGFYNNILLLIVSYELIFKNIDNIIYYPEILIDMKEFYNNLVKNDICDNVTCGMWIDFPMGSEDCFENCDKSPYNIFDVEIIGRHSINHFYENIGKFGTVKKICNTLINLSDIDKYKNHSIYLPITDWSYNTIMIIQENIDSNYMQEEYTEYSKYYAEFYNVHSIDICVNYFNDFILSYVVYEVEYKSLAYIIGTIMEQDLSISFSDIPGRILDEIGHDEDIEIYNDYINTFNSFIQECEKYQ